MPPRSRRARGHIETVASGGFRAVVYSGADPLTNKPRYIDDIAAKLNGRPRETLGFKTPSEAPNEALR